MSKPRGLYTPVYQSLTTHRKTVRVAAALNCHRIKLVGHLVALWTWSLDNVSSAGGPLSAEDIAFAAEWPVKDADRFARVLLVGEFLNVGPGNGDIGYYLHEWDLYGGKVAEAAEKDRARKGGSSVELPRKPGGIPTLDRDRDLDRDLSVSDPPTPQRMTPDQIELSRYMRHLVHREVLKGVTAPDTDWNNDLIHRGAQQSDIDYASQQCIQRDIKDLGYFRTILERRVTEREAGVDHDQLARDRAQSAAREPHGRASGARGVARNTQGSGTADDFGDAPPNSIRATDKPGTSEGVPGISSLESYRSGPRASGGAR